MSVHAVDLPWPGPQTHSAAYAMLYLQKPHASATLTVTLTQVSNPHLSLTSSSPHPQNPHLPHPILTSSSPNLVTQRYGSGQDYADQVGGMGMQQILADAVVLSVGNCPPAPPLPPLAAPSRRQVIRTLSSASSPQPRNPHLILSPQNRRRAERGRRQGRRDPRVCLDKCSMGGRSGKSSSPHPHLVITQSSSSSPHPQNRMLTSSSSSSPCSSAPHLHLIRTSSLS